MRVVQPQGWNQGKEAGQHKVRHLQRAAGIGLQGLPQDLGKRCIGRPSLGVAGAQIGLASQDAHVGDQFAHQPRLANTGLPADQQQLPIAGKDPAPQSPRFRHFPLAPHQPAALNALQQREFLCRRGFSIEDAGRIQGL